MEPAAALVAANRLQSCAVPSAGPAGLIAFASGRTVALYEPRRQRVVATLAGHTDRVNAVAWFPHPDPTRGYADERELASGSTDGTVRVWLLPAGATPDATGFVPVDTAPAVLRGHTGSVTAVAAATLHDGAAAAASVAADCSLRLWFRPPPGTAAAVSGADPAAAATWRAVAAAATRAAAVFECVALAQLPLPSAAMARAVAPADSTDDAIAGYGLVVAAGSVDCRIHLFTLAAAPAAASPAFLLQPVLTLAGHADWVRCLAFSHHAALAAHFPLADAAAAAAAEPPATSQRFTTGYADHCYLASAGQDNRVRLWRLTVKRAEPAIAAAATAAAAASVGDVDEEDEEATEAGVAAADRDEGTGTLAHSGAIVEQLLRTADPVTLALQRPRRFDVAMRVRAGTGVGGGATATSPGSTDITARYEVVFDAMLAGHDHWVTSLQWHPPVAIVAGGSREQVVLWAAPCIITASMDKTVALWLPSGDEATLAPALVDGAAQPAAATLEAALWAGVWERRVRVGSAGGAVAGIYSACMSSDGAVLMGTGYHGALHAWYCQAIDVANKARAGTWRRTGGGDDTAGTATHLRVLSSPRDFLRDAEAAASVMWQAVPAAQGHFGAVTDAAWSPDGRYLLTTSLDFTTRVWAQARIAGAPSASPGGKPDAPWVELARPQIHGYELVAAALPALAGVPHRLFAAGDEKVVRVYDAPQLFLHALDTVAAPYDLAASPSPSRGEDTAAPRAADVVARAAMSYLPELGLTTKGLSAEAAAMPVRDRLRIDGRDAEPMTPDARLVGATAAASGKGGGGGKGGGKGRRGHGDAGDGAAVVDDDVGGDGDAEDVRVTQPAASAAAPPAVPLPTGAAAPPPLKSLVSSCDADLARTFAGTGPTAAIDGAATSAPPLEEDLVQHTRWAEVDKLFGHVNEVVAVAVNTSGTMIATACKARDDAAAAIRLWDTARCRCTQVLRAHKLTTIALAFAPAPAAMVSEACGGEGGAALLGVLSQLPSAPADAGAESEFLVSVSKDRSIALFGLEARRDDPAVLASQAEAAAIGSVLVQGGSGIGTGAGAGSVLTEMPPALQNGAELPRYKLLALVEGAHRRIVWSVSWAPSPSPSRGVLAATATDGGTLPPMACFATGARDHTVRLWCISRRPTTAPAAGAAPVPSSAGAGADGGPAADLSGGISLSGGPAAAATTLSLSCAGVVMEAASAVTAVSFAPLARVERDGGSTVRLSLLLAAGEESGAMSLWRISAVSAGGATPVTWAWERLAVVDARFTHADAVRRLAWRPLHPRRAARWLAAHDGAGAAAAASDGEAGSLAVASASADEAVKLWRVPLRMLLG